MLHRTEQDGASHGTQLLTEPTDASAVVQQLAALAQRTRFAIFPSNGWYKSGYAVIARMAHTQNGRVLPSLRHASVICRASAGVRSIA